ncbi:MAG: hypothetical protein ABSE17_04275 [Candidatus Levyibacteriota bacterium]
MSQTATEILAGFTSDEDLARAAQLLDDVQGILKVVKGIPVSGEIFNEANQLSISDDTAPTTEILSEPIDDPNWETEETTSEIVAMLTKTHRKALQRSVALAILETDADGEPKYHSYYGIAAELYKRDTDPNNPRPSVKIGYNSGSILQAKVALAKKLEAYIADPAALSPDIQVLLIEIHSMPEYADMTPQELLAKITSFGKKLNSVADSATIPAEKHIVRQLTVAIETASKPITEISAEVDGAKPVEPGSLENLEIKFGNRRREVILALLKTTRNGSDFLYPKIEDLISSVYQDRILKSASDEAKKKRRNLIQAAYLSRENIIARIAKQDQNPTQKDEELESLLAEVDAIPEYNGITRGRLIYVLRRDISFARIRNSRIKAFDIIRVEHDVVITRDRKLPDCGDGGQNPKGLRDTIGNHLPTVANHYQSSVIKSMTEKTTPDKTMPLPILPRLPESDRGPRPRPSRIPYFLMMINESRTDYLFPNVDEAIEEVCQEISGRIRNKNVRAERFERFRATAKQNFQDFVDSLREYDADRQDGETPKEVHDFLYWAEHQPAYEGYTTKDILHVLAREFKVPQLTQFYAESLELSSRKAQRRETASSRRAVRLSQKPTSAVA